MIAQLKGKVEILDLRGANPYIILDTGNVGYKVYITTSESAILSEGNEIKLWTYLAVRENSQELFGFVKREELDFFELLISISGIGPKGALSILGTAPLETLKEAIGTGDTSYMTKISGIGKKTAEKVVLELRDKIEKLEGGSENSTLKGDVDVLEALKALGYSHTEAREAVKQIPESVIGVNNRVKEALKTINTK